MRRLTFIIFSFLLFSCKAKKIDTEQKIIDRIEFVFNLKQAVDRDVWNSFNDKQFDVPLIYYTDSTSFVTNPTDKFLTSFKSRLVFENRQIKIYKTDNRVDSFPFHMETGLTLGDPTDEYDYHSPFMKCSSYEEVHKKIPDVLSTEEWVTMIMHEYFHGFQYKHQPFIDYYKKNVVQVQPDSLKSIYKNSLWFKKSIDKENKLLLAAINEMDTNRAKLLIDTFFTIRNERRKETKQKLQLDIGNYEKCYETIEGTARYVEFRLYNKFATRQSTDSKLIKSDSSFKLFQKFRNFNIENDKWLYLTEETTYFYATGFNIARLLDKLKIEYKTKLFNQGGLSLEDILKDR